MEAGSLRTRTDTELADHPAVVDAQRLLDDAERSMRRRARPWMPGPSDALERRVLGLCCFAAFTATGSWVAVRSGQIPGDALSRVQLAQAVVAGRDPHLESLGFVWGPIPAVFQVPLLWFRAVLPGLSADALAAVLVSAAFMAATAAQVLGWGQRASAPRPMRTVTVALFVAHPLIWIYGANGMAEAAWLFFCVLAASRLVLWSETDDVCHLAVLGCALGAAYLARYETLVVIPAVVLFVGVVTFRRWHPVLDDAERGLAAPEDDADRFRRTMVDVTLVAMPALVAVLGWAFASWVIVGEPLAQLTSEYGNSALVEAASEGIEGLVGDASPLGRIWFFTQQVLVVAPGIVLLGLMGFGAARASRARVAAALVVFGTPLLAQLFLSYRASVFPWFRYAIAAVPLAVLIVLAMGRCAPAIRWLAVAVLGLGMLTSTATIRAGALASEDDELFMHSVLGEPPPRSESLLGVGAEIAGYIGELPGVSPGSVLCDSAACFAALVNAERPELYVITSDRDFEPIAADPREFGVRWVLLRNPETSPDQVAELHPGLWDGTGEPIAEEVMRWEQDGQAELGFRLYEVVDPEGEPIVAPTGEFG